MSTKLKPYKYIYNILYNIYTLSNRLIYKLILVAKYCSNTLAKYYTLPFPKGKGSTYSKYSNNALAKYDDGIDSRIAIVLSIVANTDTLDEDGMAEVIDIFQDEYIPDGYECWDGNEWTD